MRTDILLLCPLQGNGGIQSWTRKYLTDFPNSDYRLYPVDIAPDKAFTDFRGLDNWKYGIKSFIRAYKCIKKVIRQNPQIQLMHTTTSGGNGTLRDYYLGKYCKKKGLKIIMHCRFGAIEELYQDRGWKGMFFHRALRMYDQIWVLDQHSADILKSHTKLKNKVFLVPNPIEVPTCNVIQSKQYKRVGFIGNILPSKGVFELIEAVLSLNNDTELVFAGKGSTEDIDKLLKIIQSNESKTIRYHGRLSNDEAVKLMSSLDILCLPTYYDLEAFPISILEAMSMGKMVISCARAAIPDMLKGTDGTPCGLIVMEKSSQAIADAIRWCQDHQEEANVMCKKAYEKAYHAYRKEVVYDIYRSNYNQVLSR